MGVVEKNRIDFDVVIVIGLMGRREIWVRRREGSWRIRSMVYVLRYFEGTFGQFAWAL